MAQPDVTVIIPVYNAMHDGGEMLRACVASVLAQQGVKLEIIVVDDGSTDGTPSHPALADERLRLICMKKNRGLSAARNAGLEVASGRYVSFVDADDLLLPDALARMLKVAENTGVRIVVGKITRCEPKGELKATDAVNIFTPGSFVQRTLYQRGGHNSAVAMLIATDLMRRMGFREGWYYEDLLSIPRLYLLTDRVAVLDRQVYFYRHNPSSFLNTWSEKRLDVLRVCEENVEYMAEHCPEALPAAKDRLMSAAFNIYLLARKNGRPDVCARCRSLIRTHRRASLLNPKVRVKNRLGAMLSYLIM